MRMLGLVGAYKSDGKKLNSGVVYYTQPADIPLGALAYEDGNTFQFVRMSGTATVGSFVYLTGTTVNYVCCSGTGGVKPLGVLMGSPTASGAWTWIQREGKNTSIQITSTFSTAKGYDAMYVNGGSGALNMSDAVSGLALGTAGLGWLQVVGQSLTAAAGSQTVGYLRLL